MAEARTSAPRRLHAADLASALPAWGLAHPEGTACAGDAALLTSDEAWGVEHEGELAAIGVARAWGRVGQIHALYVAEPLRRRGIGSALLESLIGSLARRDATVVGVEVDAGGASALTFLARAGFRPMNLSFVLERAIGGEGDASEEPADLPMLRGPEAMDGLDPVRGIAASVDADFDPTAWMADRLSRAEAEITFLPRDGGGEPAGFAVVSLPSGGADALFVSMVVAEDGPPHAGLRKLVASLEAQARSRGLSRVQVAAPSRYWDATRALLDLGYRPRASYLRLTLQGHSERADTRRCYLTAWR